MNPALTSAQPAAVATVRQGRTLALLLGRFRPVWRGATVLFAVLLARSALEIAYPLLIARVVGQLEARAGGGGSLPDGFALVLWILGGVIAVRAAGFYVTGVLAARLSLSVETRLRADLFARVLHLRFAYHDRNRSGATIVRALRDMEKTRHFYREVWFGYLEMGLLVVAVVIASFACHVSYGIAMAIVFGAGALGCVLTGRRIAQLDRGVSEHFDGMTTVLQENVAGARVVRAFGRGEQESQKFGSRMDGLSSSWARVERYWTARMPGVHNFFTAAIPIVLVLGAWRIAAGSGGLDEVTAVLLYARTVHHRLRPLARLVVLGQQATASASRVFEVLEETDDIPGPARPRRLPPGGGALHFEDVHFAYADGPEVLRGVALHVPAGGSLGLIGVTGAGKSTLVQLLPRFYDPTRGRILLDGVDLRELDVHDLRAAVGLVFQEPFLFSGTVRENVAYGRPGASPADVEGCVRQAAAHDFVTELPEGYETLVGERGVSLSGGQCQRLTIARALAMDPRVLVFDDATASVDAVTEKRLFEGIRAAARGRTTLVVSQRVTSVRWCDAIAVLEDGRIAAQGTHEELLERSPLYREIHGHQRLSGVLP